jgi:uncharacterized membrane protein YfcA
MDADLAVVLGSVAIFFLVAAGWYLHKEGEDSWKPALPLFIGALVIGALGFSPTWNPSGDPINGHIEAGTYKVAFVYVAGENVNVALEMKVNKDSDLSREYIRYYQFKVDAFDGTPNSNAKKLVVIETGSFKKLRLE